MPPTIAQPAAAPAVVAYSPAVDPATTAAWAAHLPAGARVDELDLAAGGTLPAAWGARWAADPGAPLLWTADGEATSAGAFEALTRAIAGRLRAAGLSLGDRVLFGARSSVDLAAAHVGALRAGLVVVPANPAFTAAELCRVALDARPRAAVVDSEQQAGWLRAAIPGLVVTGPAVDLPDGTAAGLDSARPTDPAMIMYTSGTTGVPKGAVLTHANLLASSIAVGVAWRWSPADRLILALPMFHAHGLCVALHGTLLAGASAVLLPRFDVDAILDGCRDGATMFFGVPTMYHRLAASDRAAELSSLRLCVSGSAPLAADLHHALHERTGQAVLERYGLTETLMNISNPYDGERRAGSVGLPLPGVEVRVDAAGQLLVRGPSVFAGYWEHPEETAAVLRDGWMHTGDLGARDPDGYFRILGRARELIISGGYNVYPREVEDVLAQHPGVVEAAVVGTPSEEWGEVVTAYVVAAPEPPSADDLEAFAATRLAPYKRPRIVRFVDALPRNALGKVLKQQLG